MRMCLRCTGGFTGPAGSQTYSIDLAQLPPAQAASMHGLVQASGFFGLPQKMLKPAPQSQDMRYSLQIDDGVQSHCVQYHLDAAPAPLRTLTEQLSASDPD